MPLVYLAVILAVQFAADAFRAEFMAQPDEASHFVTAVMLRDYAGAGFPTPAMSWAIDYYLHYPKVGLGHWPPGYYALLAGWWLLFPVARWSAILLNTAMALAMALVFHRTASRVAPGWPAVLSVLLLLVAGEVQNAMNQTMADLPSLLCGVWTLEALLLCLEGISALRLFGLSAAIAAALLVKGTGAALVPGVAVALVAGRIWRHPAWSWRLAAIPPVVAVLPASWYLFQHFVLRRDVTAWSGARSAAMEWPIALGLGLAGAGLVVLALCGAIVSLRFRKSEGLAAFCLAISMAGSSYFLRAMAEERHWLAILPPLILLVFILFAWLRPQWPRLAIAALAAALLALRVLPASAPREGFHAMAAAVTLPGRFLVSTPIGWTEGAWIAEVALREARPASTIVRATKLLADSGWGRGNYTLLTQSSEDVLRLLDEAGVETVIALETGDPQALPHHPVLLRAVQTSDSWRPCRTQGRVHAYCRAAPPRYPRRDIELDMRERIGQPMILDGNR